VLFEFNKNLSIILYNAEKTSTMKFVLDMNHLGLKSLAVLFLLWQGWYIYSALSLRARMAKLGKQAVVTRRYLPFGIDTMLKALIVRSSMTIS
jgi:hypothetical protein